MDPASMQQSSSVGRQKYKLVFLGDMATGKSSIIERFMKGSLNERHNPTVGIDFIAKNVIHDKNLYRLQLWDTGGQERFRSLIPSYLKDAQCAVFVYDVTNRESFQNLKQWIHIFDENRHSEAIGIILGNKIDLQRKVSQAEAKEAAKFHKMPYYQCSARTAENLDRFFEGAIDHINQTQCASTDSTNHNEQQPPPSSRTLSSGASCKSFKNKKDQPHTTKLPQEGMLLHLTSKGKFSLMCLNRIKVIQIVVLTLTTVL